jgi:hypothetical protein
MAADPKNQGALDARDLIASMVFWLRGDIVFKFRFYFQVFCSFTDGSYITEEHLKQPILKAIASYKEHFFNAKRACDTMNTDCNGRISFAEFRNFCLYNP